VLGKFHEHGVTIALDDFGTGYSSLSRLKRFPLDALKIDRSFVSGVVCHGDDHAIVKATIDMAHAVGLIVVAEGVETREQEDCLRALGCDRAQGYLYARPQPAPAIAALLGTAVR
jgi:EAL domain-containing protein (putative c-di-GMP-specific phosphodiesterase class I)